ncbi:MAG: hypothetical protein FVQ81_00395 [Candidatus Glassbacteria bacterium]|nr:hypothetical protein [Candidatus Glassbacteria bacterium]
MTGRCLRSCLLSALLVVAAGLVSCSDGSTSPETGDRVVDALPLALGNRWEYALEQSIFVQEDTTLPAFEAFSTGRQIVTINRTENIGGLEAFALKFDHVMGFVFRAGADTVLERRYLAPTPDGKVLLKADEAVYNPTGGFIPFSHNESGTRLGTMIEIGGKERFISLNKLAYLIADPRGSILPRADRDGSLLASDGIQNNENAIFYENEYIFLFNELYKGLKWVSLAAGGVGGVDISQRVSNILPELDGYDGPIAEIEETNTLVGAAASEFYVQRFYYKGGVGLIRAEISDPEFLIIAQFPDGSIEFIGIGTWTFIKTLTSYSLR